MQGVPYVSELPRECPILSATLSTCRGFSVHAVHRTGHKWHSVDSRDSNTESEAWEMDATKQGHMVIWSWRKEVSRNPGSTEEGWKIR